MKLYFTRGACSLSPHIVLRELGLDFELEAVDLAAKRTASGEDFTAVNPMGYVPALRLDDGEVLTEGVAISQYLSDRHAPGRLAAPAGTLDRARLQARLNFISSELHKAFSPLFAPNPSAESRAAAVAKIGRCLDALEQDLGDGRAYIQGADFSLADTYLFAVASWAEPRGVSLAKWPKLQALLARIGDRPAVKQAIAAETRLAEAA